MNDAAKRALDEGRDRYCAVAGIPALREEIAHYLRETRGVKVSANNIVLAPGCKIGLFMAMMALINPGDEVLYPEPGFPAYRSITQGLGGIPVPFELAERNHLQPDPDEIAAKITSRTTAIITNSPGNPTGTVYTDEVQRRIAELADKARSLCAVRRNLRSNHLWTKLYFDHELPGDGRRTIIIDGFSKSFAMTGWRLGYNVAPPSIVSALEMLAVNSYTCVNEFIQYGAIEALRDRKGHTTRMVDEFEKRRTQFARELNSIPGFRIAPPQGAFYAWVNIADTGIPAEEVCRLMLEEAGVAAIAGAAFGESGRNFVRFSFASSIASLHEAVERIRRVSHVWERTAVAR